jgi:triacylglycerol lipase
MRREVATYAVALLPTAMFGCGTSGTTEPGFVQLDGAGGADTTGVGGASTTSTTSGVGAGGAMTKGPPYPIVLAHGFFGFEEFAGLDFATYYFQVREHLAAHGEHQIYTPAVDPFNSSTHRGAQLAAAIQEILAETGHAKVNIVGHSQGGLDARVVAHDHPELVASVVTLQTPHFGTPISDIAMEILDDPNLQQVLDWIVQAIGAPLYDEVGQLTSISAAIAQFSAPAVQAFNTKYTDQPGIWYASIVGRSDHHKGGSACITASPPFIAAFEQTTDPIDPLFALTEAMLDGGWNDPYPNDGLVRVVDGKWGDFLGCLPADHLDMVGHLFGDHPGGSNTWDYRQFYVDLVGLLRQKGF